MKTKSTYSLDMLLITVCTNNQSREAISSILEGALQLYQWAYQNTNDAQQYRDAENGTTKAVEKCVKLLRNMGDNTMANSVESALEEYSKDSILRRSKVLSSAKKYMKEECIKKIKISKENYSKKISKLIENAFIELCEEYPIESPPEHFDSNFDPYAY